MTKQEFAVWAMAAKTYYPQDKLFANKEQLEIYYRELQEYDAETLTAALRIHMNSTEKNANGYLVSDSAPKIGRLRMIIEEIRRGKVPDWGDGWLEVTKAIRKYGYMNEEKALASMSPTTQEAVKRIGWQDICLSENPEVLRAQFRQIFERCSQREIQDRTLPKDLLAKIDTLRIGSFEKDALPPAKGGTIQNAAS